MERDGPLKMSDIARMAKVSVSTVSRALADNPLIPIETREFIQKIANDAGYVINQSARSLRLRKTDTIAVVFPLGHEEGQLLSDPFFIEMFGRLADEITLRDYQILLRRVTKTAPGWLDRIIQSQQQDGIIIVGQSDQETEINKTASTYSQIVVWGGGLPDRNYNSVGTENRLGAKKAVQHLINLGRDRIVFLGVPELPEVGLRLQGYKDACAEAGIVYNPDLIVPTNFAYDAAYQTIVRFIQSKKPFDGIFAASDVIALAAIQALKKFNLSVPEDVAIVGYDDIAMASQSSPSISTVRQDLRLGASQMVDLLFKKMNGQAVESVTLLPELVIRQSCGGASARP